MTESLSQLEASNIRRMNDLREGLLTIADDFLRQAIPEHQVEEVKDVISAIPLLPLTNLDEHIVLWSSKKDLLDDSSTWSLIISLIFSIADILSCDGEMAWVAKKFFSTGWFLIQCYVS